MRCDNVDWSAVLETAPLSHAFGYGQIRLQTAEILWLRCESEEGAGFAASLLAPEWFDRSSATVADKRAALLGAVAVAAREFSACGILDRTGRDAFLSLRDTAASRCEARLGQSLTTAFGIAMVESACLEIWCRRHATDLATAIRSSWFHGESWAKALPGVKHRVGWRHTVGLSDDLVESASETSSATSLESVVEAGKCRWFKVKVDGSPAMLPRLQQIAELLDGCLVGDYALTLDGNESFGSASTLRQFVDTVLQEPSLRSFAARILWFEQPLARAVALPPSSNGTEHRALREVLADLTERGLPVILDESGDGEDTLRRGLDCGYAGISAKVCKGVARAVRHAAEAKRSGAILSAEDLTCPAGLALHRHLALASALGVEHAEVNGLHYLVGGGIADAGKRTALAECHDALYRMDDGRLQLRLDEDGCLDVERVAAAAFAGDHAVQIGWRSLSQLLES